MKSEPVSEQDRLVRENARLRGDLLTVATRISHDLRTPLGGIVSTGEILREMLAEKDPASAALTNSLFHSVEELSKLIKSVSAVAKASARPRAKEKIHMGGIVSGVLQKLESRALKMQAAILEPRSWPEVEGVEPWLEIIWWNFLANALQHAGESPRIELGWREEAGKIRFWISDNGPGVPAGRLNKLFQAFDSLHEPDGARGLGLSIVQRLVELQGGDCGHETNSTGGARFYFTLPKPAP
ncbi:MAG TPA: HAMP domain-containing sensor histidine kinase [Verrucomicrobiae bacterium]|jgi:signal transduction histidine kinase